MGNIMGNIMSNIMPCRRQLGKITFTASLIICSIFFISLGIMPAQAEDLISTYQIVKEEHPEFIDKLKEGGSNEGEIESFLTDLNKVVNEKGNLNKNNFNSILKQSLMEVILADSHSSLYEAMMNSFAEEIAYTLANGSLHSSLVPLQTAVKNSVLGTEQPTPGGPSGGSGSGNDGKGTKEGKVEEQSAKNTDKDTTKPQGKEAEAPKQEEQSKLVDITGHWAEENIKKLIETGAISGYPDNTFLPNRNITRAEFTAILVKALGLESEQQQTFTDTAKHWAKEYIAIAAAHGLVKGYDENTFGPNDFITREQMAVMIVLGLQLDHLASDKIFADNAAISHWATAGVQTALATELIKGYPDNTFRPKANSTRAEAATVIVNALK